MWPFASIIFEKSPVGPEGWEAMKVGSLECGSGNAECGSGNAECGRKLRRLEVEKLGSWKKGKMRR
jgi:hypothetical protein